MQRVFAVSLVLAAACGSSTRTVEPAPKWFPTPPKARGVLLFAGDATQQPGEGQARDQAIAKALDSLSVYCGAKITSESKSFQRETNGQLETIVEMSVDVAGEQIEIREMNVKELLVHEASDGTYDGYAMIEWPRAQYEAVLAAKRNKAKRALDLHLAAKGLFGERDFGGAKGKLREARGLLGGSVSIVKLDHPKIQDSGVLRSAMSALRSQIEAAEKEAKSVCAVAVRCLKEGVESQCRASRAGSVQQAVSGAGRKVSADAVPSDVTAAILTSSNPDVGRQVRGAGCVVAVQYPATLREKSKPFTFVDYGARVVVFDTSSKRIVDSHEWPPRKMGHVNFNGAMKKGFDKVEREVTQRVKAALKKM